MQQQISFDVWNAYPALKEADERIDNTTTFMDNSQENLNIAEGEYREGIGSMIDVTDAQTALLMAEQSRIEPSHIPEPVRLEVIQKVLASTGEEMFAMKLLPDFQHKKTPGSFNKAKCELCGAYVFERYLRKKDGKLMCITCSEYAG